MLRGGLFCNNAGEDILQRLLVFQETVNAASIPYFALQRYTRSLTEMLCRGNNSATAWILSHHPEKNMPDYIPPLVDLFARLSTHKP